MVHSRIETNEDVDVGILREAIQFRCGRICRNRIMKAPTTEMISSWHATDLSKRGIPSEEIINAYTKWGHGGYGIIITGFVSVDPNHIENPGNVIVCKENYSEKLLTQLKRYAAACKAAGSLAIMQISHAGSMTPDTVNKFPFSSSDVVGRPTKFFRGCGHPVPYTTEQIQTEVIDRFVFAAKVAQEAGFDGVQIHGFHGFLLSQFVSAKTNLRNDKYGGSIENRTRIIVDVFTAVRNAIPSSSGFIIGTKINTTDFPDIEHLQEGRHVVRTMEKLGYDFVLVAGGNFEASPPTVVERETTLSRQALFNTYAKMIREEMTTTPIFGAGNYRTSQGMVDSVMCKHVDGVAIGRPTTAEPDIAAKILNGDCFSASDSKIPANDFPLSQIAANTQILQLGSTAHNDNMDLDYGVVDLSDPEQCLDYVNAVDNFKKSIKEQMLRNEVIIPVFRYHRKIESIV